MSSRLDDTANAAIGLSFLNVLPLDDQAAFLEGALRVDVPAGSVVYRDEDPSRVVLIVSGLVRVYLTSAAGRQVTIRYCRPGAVLGISTAAAGPILVSAQAITDASMLFLDEARIRRLGMTNARLSWAMLVELTERLYGVLDAFSGTVFGTVRQRVARHLLDLAAENQSGEQLIAPISQQALADAVGSAREVVTRDLHDLRQKGLVETRRAGIVVLDPIGLQELAEADL
jgi:CRP/FNR family transcriptional regulator